MCYDVLLCPRLEMERVFWRKGTATAFGLTRNTKSHKSQAAKRWLHMNHPDSLLLIVTICLFQNHGNYSVWGVSQTIAHCPLFPFPTNEIQSGTLEWKLETRTPSPIAERF